MSRTSSLSDSDGVQISGRASECDASPRSILLSGDRSDFRKDLKVSWGEPLAEVARPCLDESTEGGIIISDDTRKPWLLRVFGAVGIVTAGLEVSAVSPLRSALQFCRTHAPTATGLVAVLALLVGLQIAAIVVLFDGGEDSSDRAKGCKISRDYAPAGARSGSGGDQVGVRSTAAGRHTC
eukprot:CAMPEP_0170623118 /NCGR_PEP_ID=MMETSP0224-20130122/29517_1 /TAXON_ID=285029 /ORGANISM="Togula jolla, Strain CCCM 725" /LENGTH=180 /DNA_ID=CAMNT_0010949529 /DNA_START=53 /DNA_END=595 /DNA_ORIENTATION=+